MFGWKKYQTIFFSQQHGFLHLMQFWDYGALISENRGNGRKWTKGRRASHIAKLQRALFLLDFSGTVGACQIMWLTEPKVLIWVFRAKITSLPRDSVFSVILETILVVHSQWIFERLIRSLILEKAKILMTLNCFLALKNQMSNILWGLGEFFLLNFLF